MTNRKRQSPVLAPVTALLLAACDLYGTAPPHRDIVTRNAINVYLRSKAELENPDDQQAILRAARTIEILFTSPVDLNTFANSSDDHDVALIRDGGEPEWLDDSVLMSSWQFEGWEFKRTRFAKIPGEGNCVVPSGDRTCDTLLLHLRHDQETDLPEAVPVDTTTCRPA